MRFKNYRRLCEFLDEKPKAGDSKNSQIKEWSRYFSFKRDKNAWIIDEVYEVPYPKVDGRRKGNNELYVKDIEVLLLYLLHKQEQETGSGVLCITRKNLEYQLGMYNKYYQNEDVSADALNFIDAKITKVQLKAFYFRSNKNLGDILERALKSLKAQCLIEYEEQWVKIVSGKHVLVDKELYPDILDCKKAILDEHGYRTPFPFVIQGRQKEFYTEFVNRVKDEVIPNVDGIYKRLRITYARNHLAEGILQNWQDRVELINKARQDLNGKVVIRMNTDAENNYSSYLKMYGPSIGRDGHFSSAQVALGEYLLKLETNLDGKLAEYEEFRESQEEQGDFERQIFDDLPFDELGWI